MTPTIPQARPRTLLSLSSSPEKDPVAWAEAATLGGAHAIAMISLPRRAVDGSAPALRALVADGIDRLSAAGVEPVGHVSLGYATRPLVELLWEINRWAVLPVNGIFLDHAPAGPFQVGPIALAARMARKAGLRTLILNAGVPVDPMYRRLEATVCTFEGSWHEYREWSADGTEPGDGHLVYGVPRSEWEIAWALIAARGAGLGLVTDRTGPYTAVPALPGQSTGRPTPATSGAR